MDFERTTLHLQKISLPLPHLAPKLPQKPQKNCNFALWGKYVHAPLRLLLFFPLKTITKNNHDNECSRKLHAPTETNRRGAL